VPESVPEEPGSNLDVAWKWAGNNLEFAGSGLEATWKLLESKPGSKLRLELLGSELDVPGSDPDRSGSNVTGLK